MKFLFVLFCCLATARCTVAQNNTNWILVWSDEFTQPDGISPDPARWSYDIGATGWGNNELEYYTSRTNNVRIEDGKLIIEAKQENFSSADYTSGRLKTQGKASWTYGRVEARIAIPRGQGIWPAFWLLGTNFSSVGWPNCGEIDIMENIGSEPATIKGTIHGPGYSGGDGIGGSYSLPGNLAFADDFHVYGIEWTTNQIKWTMDGEQYFAATPSSLPSGKTWVFTQPEFLILNVAVGGNWPGNPDGTTVFPQRMTVDYVRVYAISNAQTVTSGTLLNGDFESGVLAPWIGKDCCCANPAGGVITDTDGLVWDPTINADNNQGIRNPAFGRYSCKIYGNFNGGPNSPGIYQDVAALPGSVWTASIKARTQDTDYIRDANQAVAEVSFLGTTGALLAKYTSQVFDTNTPINSWTDLQVTRQIFPTTGTTNQMLSPPGTATIRFEVTFSQTLYDWGSIYFDEAQLVEVLPPVPPTLRASFIGSGNIQISFETQQGANYQVLDKLSLSESDWQPVETIPGDGTTQSVFYPVDGKTRFYRVEMF